MRYRVTGRLLVHSEADGREGLRDAGTNRHLWQNYRKFCELQDDLTKLKREIQPKKNIVNEIEEVKASNRVLTMQVKSMK